MTWNAFSYEDKTTAPATDELVWIFEVDYIEGAGLGYFDGFTFRMWHGSDDCHVTHWSPIIYPAAPEE